MIADLPGGAAWAAMCEHPSWRRLYAGLLARCERCGLVATAERPEFDYEAGYFTGGNGGGYDFDSPFAQAMDAARFGAELRRLEAQGLKGSLLDIGCATGRFLRQAQARGWTVAGVEVAEFARQAASDRLGVGIAGSLDELPAGERHDVVTLHHVLEHIHDPLPFLRDSVAPRVGKRLLIEVPNFGSLASRAYGDLWQDLRPEQHVCHFDRPTLGQLATSAGFSVVRVYSLWVPLWTLRTAGQLLGMLPALLRPAPRDAATPRPRRAAPTASAYRPPTGWRRLGARGSQIALGPLVRILEAAGFGERLVLEAEPSVRRTQER